ncbi:MAG: immunoglobulin domain-containing protein [Terracidiphilus sp.]
MIRSKMLSFCTLSLLLSSIGAVTWAQQAAPSAAAKDPSITTQPANAFVKVGTTATFSVTATGATTLKYQWYKNNGLINGATSAKYTTPATTDADNNANFYVHVSDTAGSLNSNTVYLYVADSAPVMQMQPASLTVTAPAVATFEASASDSNYNDITSQWYKNGKAVGSVQFGSWATYSTEETNTVDNGAKFTVKFTNGAGSVTSNPAVLTVKPANISGTYPIVGEWTGTATITGPDKSTTTSQVIAAFSQTSYSITGTVVFTDDNGVPDYGAGTAALNGQNVYTAVGDDSGTTSIVAGFTTNLLTLNGMALGSDGSGGSGQLVISADHSTLTGTATASDGTKISWNLTRAK